MAFFRFVHVEESVFGFGCGNLFFHAFVWCCEACSFVAIFDLSVRLLVSISRCGVIARSCFVIVVIVTSFLVASLLF